MSTALALIPAAELAGPQGGRGELAHGAFEDENLVEQGMTSFAGLMLSVEAGGSAALEGVASKHREVIRCMLAEGDKERRTTVAFDELVTELLRIEAVDKCGYNALRSAIRESLTKTYELTHPRPPGCDKHSYELEVHVYVKKRVRPLTTALSSEQRGRMPLQKSLSTRRVNRVAGRREALAAASTPLLTDVNVAGEDVGAKRRRVAPTPRGRKVPAIALTGQGKPVWSETRHASAEAGASSSSTERDSPTIMKDVSAAFAEAVEDIDSASADDDATVREVREGTELLAEPALRTQSR